MRREFTSPKLLGFTIDHDTDRTRAPAHSTGKLVLDHDGDPSSMLDWYTEFDCETCGSKFLIYRPEFHDLMREVLADNGIDAR